jgi:hypothetical protein
MTTDSIGHETGCEQNHSFMMAWRVHEFGPRRQWHSSPFHGRIPAPVKS